MSEPVFGQINVNIIFPYRIWVFVKVKYCQVPTQYVFSSNSLSFTGWNRDHLLFNPSWKERWHLKTTFVVEKTATNPEFKSAFQILFVTNALLAWYILNFYFYYLTDQQLYTIKQLLFFQLHLCFFFKKKFAYICQ